MQIFHLSGCFTFWLDPGYSATATIRLLAKSTILGGWTNSDEIWSSWYTGLLLSADKNAVRYVYTAFISKYILRTCDVSDLDHFTILNDVTRYGVMRRRHVRYKDVQVTLDAVIAIPINQLCSNKAWWSGIRFN